MKNQNNSHWQSSLLITIVAIFLLGAFNFTFAQAGIGAKYGARDPRTCADKKSPRTGALSAAQATEYVTCASEGVFVTSLFLVENVSVQIGKARPYNIREDINFPNIDTKFPVYPIRGSFREYVCTPIYGDRHNLNRNCWIKEEPNAKGACYKDSFGEWDCAMTDALTSHDTDRDVPPPGGAKQTNAPVDKKNGQNNQQNDDRKPAENKTEAAGRDANGFPKPDLSALERWYEILRYEYEPIEGRLNIVLKPKVENRETEFLMEFKDKDDILVVSRDYTHFVHMPGSMDAKVGDTVKVYVYTPRENILKQAVSAKAVRRQ